MVSNKCCVKSCSSSRKGGWKLYSLPSGAKDFERREQWLRKLGLPVSSGAKRGPQICAKHFDKDDFFVAENFQRLKPHVIPHLLLEPAEHPDSSTGNQRTKRKRTPKKSLIEEINLSSTELQNNSTKQKTISDNNKVELTVPNNFVFTAVNEKKIETKPKTTSRALDFDSAIHSYQIFLLPGVDSDDTAIESELITEQDHNYCKNTQNFDNTSTELNIDPLQTSEVSDLYHTVQSNQNDLLEDSTSDSDNEIKLEKRRLLLAERKLALEKQKIELARLKFQFDRTEQEQLEKLQNLERTANIKIIKQQEECIDLFNTWCSK